jgi:hypothetical protein
MSFPTQTGVRLGLARRDADMIRAKFIKCTESQSMEIRRVHPDLTCLTTTELTPDTCVVIDDFRGIHPRVDTTRGSPTFGVLTCSLDYFLSNYHEIRRANFLKLASPDGS